MSSKEGLSNEPMLLTNEFGSALVSLDRSANGVRLRIEDPRSGSHIMLDPYELQCLSYLGAADIAEFMRPSFQEARAEGTGDWPPDKVEDKWAST